MDLKAKAEEINLVLSEPDVNLWKLRGLALTEGGLVNDNLRKRAWPILVGLHDYYVEKKPKKGNPNKGSPNKGNVPPRPPMGRGRPPMRPPMSPRLGVSLVSSRDDDDDDDDSSVVSANSVDTCSTFGSTYSKITAGLLGSIPECFDADQIDRDVSRCTWHLLNGNQRSRRTQMENKHRKRVAQLLKKKQRRLGYLINLTLLRTYEDFEGEKLCYYQGYHDVASIFLSTLGGGGRSPSSGSESVTGIAASLGLDLPSAVLSRVSSSHFRDAMRSNFMQLQTAIRLLLMPLICYFDPEVHDFLLACDMEPFFALSWIITWFSHDIRDTAMVKRLFDAFLVSHPLLPLYMTVAMVCHVNNRAEVLAAECDFAIVHSTLAALPKNSNMVGWTFKPHEDGYVSGDETDDDINMTSMEVSLLMEEHQLEGRDDEESETHSLISSQISIGSRGTKVPFQELIDNALTYMRRIPPRKLIHLTKIYFAEETLKPMLNINPSIEFLKPHPKWGLISTAPADWVLKQRARQREGRKTNRRDRRGRSRSRSCTRNEPKTDSSEHKSDSSKTKPEKPPLSSEDDEIAKFLEEQKKMIAVIACGFGAGDEEEIRSRKRRRLFWASVSVAVLAISVAVVLNSGLLEPSNNGGEQQQQCNMDGSSSQTPRNSKRASFFSKSAANPSAANLKNSFSHSTSVGMCDAAITPSEAKLLVEPMAATGASMAQNAACLIVDSKESTAEVGSVAPASFSFVDQMLKTMFHCPSIFNKKQVHNTIRKIGNFLKPKQVHNAIRKIGSSLKTFFRNLAKPELEEIEL